MTNEERQDYLYGKIAGLACAVRALIQYHPAKQIVTAQFEANVGATDDLALPEPISESYRVGLAELKDYLLALTDDPTIQP